MVEGGWGRGEGVRGVGLVWVWVRRVGLWWVGG